MINFYGIKRYFIYFYQSKKMNILLSILSIIFFGIFGILPLGYSIYNNIVLFNELQFYINKSEEKINFLNKANNELLIVQPLLEYFTYIMPDKSDISQYLVSLDSLLIYNGFFTERINTNVDTENKKINLNATIYGYGNLPSLIKSIEDLKRLSQINSINLTNTKGRSTINLSITIFYQ